MKSILVLVSLVVASGAFAADKWEGHKKIEGYVHPEKTRGALVVTPGGLGDDARVAGDLRAEDCSVGCSQACVSLARRILNDCGSVPGPVPGPIQQGCIDTMREFYRQRSETSADQDRADAVAYCAAGAQPQCASESLAIFKKRQETTASADRTDAGRFCLHGGTFSCLSQVYEEYRRRSGTSVTQDVNDSAAVCARWR
jgi:hypothetical protein